MFFCFSFFGVNRDEKALRDFLLSMPLAFSAVGTADEWPSVSNNEYWIAEKRAKILAMQAYEGSAESAMKLSDQYFNDLATKDRTRAKENALYWALIAEENGSSDGQFRAFQLLGDSEEK
jgi:hypothetical protein